MKMPRILIIDDDEIIVELLSLTFELEGFVVDSAANGEIGLEKVLDEPFDLVLLDILMPKLDGVGFLIKYREASETNIPVMVVSSAVSLPLRKQLEGLGVADIVCKPVNPAKLTGRAKAILQSPSMTSSPA